MSSVQSNARHLTFLVLLVVGCSRGLPPEEVLVGPDGQPISTAPLTPDVDLSTASESLDLAELLKAPRAELAQRADELEKTIRRQQQFRQEGTLPYTLLPDTRLPLATPVFQRAAWNKERGVSLPPYLKADARDSAVAYHVARHGDLEAANKLVDPADEETARLIKETASEKAYPLEWTRLVSLLILSNQISLATDSKDGAKNLIALHKQLRTVLDAKAKNGPLGAVLLGRGLSTLDQAATAWKIQGRDDLARQVQAYLATLGPRPGYALAMPRQVDDLAAVFAAKPGPNALVAADPRRVADLLCLFLPIDDADTCVAFGDDSKKLSEMLITYRPQLFQYHTPEQLAEPLEELSIGRPSKESDDAPSRIWELGPVRLTLTLTPRHPTLGAVVRVSAAGGDRTVALAREFGPVHLDRTFEANRRLAAWGKRGASLTLTDKAAADIPNPLPSRPVVDVVLDKEPKQDLVGRVMFQYADNKETQPAAGLIARPLFESAGRPQFKFGPAGTGAIDMLWHDAQTQYRLRFPYAQGRKVTLDVTDNTSTDPAERAKLAADKDVRDRRARLDSGKPLAVIPRAFDNLKLGMTRAEFQKSLPRSEFLYEREIPGGMMAAFVGSAAAGDAVAREWFGRFESDKFDKSGDKSSDRLVEFRIRYADVPSNKPGTFTKKVDAIKAKLGLPEATLDTSDTWSDMPKRGVTGSYTWHDDLTRLTCKQEPFGLEVTVRDCPVGHADGAPLSEMAFLGRGIGNVQLGMSKEALVSLGAKPVDDAYVIEGGSKDYSAVMAWVEADKVVRIIARHKAAPIKGEANASTAIRTKWGTDARALGWPLRQDVVAGNIQSFANRDDQTRYRLFWNEESGGIAVFSEWKDVRRK